MSKKRKKRKDDIDIKKNIAQTILIQNEFLSDDPRREISSKPIQNGHEIIFRTKPHGKITSTTKASLATQNSGRNIGQFYTHVYSGLFHQEKEAIYNFEERIRIGEESIQFRPDIKTDGLNETEYIEVKGKTLQGAQVACGKSQIENYAWAAIRDFYLGKNSLVNYAIFRYGNNHENLRLHSKKSTNALEELATKTKEGLILPFNLFLFLLSISRKETRLREEEKNQDYFILSGKAISILRDADKFNARDFINKYREHFLKGSIDIYGHKRNKLDKSLDFSRKRSLCLSDIVVKHKMSDEMREMHYNGTQVTPFPVTIYSLRDPYKWAENFANNHGHILKALKLRDLYFEGQKANRPF